MLIFFKEEKSYFRTFISIEEESYKVNLSNTEIANKIKEIKESVIELINNLIKYLNTLSQLKNYLFDIIDRESFIFSFDNDILDLKEKISKICEEIDSVKFYKALLNTESIKYVYQEKNEFPRKIIENLKSLELQ